MCETRGGESIVVEGGGEKVVKTINDMLDKLGKELCGLRQP